MGRPELIRELHRWAAYQAQRHRPFPRASNDDAEDSGPGDHPLSRARQFAPGTRENAAKLLRGRDGTSRRQAMAAVAGVQGMNAVPVWACDPVPCKESRIAGPLPMATIDHGIPAEVAWVERGLQSLRRRSPIEAIVLEVEVTVNASQLVKARIAAEKYGGHLSKWQYRRVLALALSFMEGQRG
jgi:hypothetical protein